MSRSAPSMDNCRCCGLRMTVAGFARVAHWRKHCRDGLATELQGTPVSFALTDKGAALAERVADLNRRISDAKRDLKEAEGNDWTEAYTRMNNLIRERDDGLEFSEVQS